jgi:hypothetical protein
MLRETTEVVRRRMAKGETLEQIQKHGLPEEWDSWGGGFIDSDRWIATLHRSLEGP